MTQERLANLHTVNKHMKNQQEIRIAVVEDHRILREVMISTFDRVSDVNVVLYAENGKDLITKLEVNSQIDIILLDIQMPVMDGRSTLVYLKEHFPELKVIMFSTHKEAKTVELFKSLGAHSFVFKGDEFNKLMHTINRVYEKGSYYGEFN